MKTLRRLIVFGLIAIVAAVAAAAIWLKSTGLSARPAPGALEIALSRRARHFAIPEKARALQNPMTASPELLTEGRRHFADHCAGCHSNDGSGRTEMGEKLYPRAPDMRLPQTQQLTDGELYYIIQNGVRLTGMPAWGEGTPDDHQSWHVVLFIRHLPQLTPAELADMERYNPRSPAEQLEGQQEEEFLNAPPEKTKAPAPKRGKTP
ncbi:MAG TPA: c-type cytochrome [Candidatus Acidoferrales bacterium]|nr:c-type cytochrome [Candidatus Acidoferrales bacterium]